MVYYCPQPDFVFWIQQRFLVHPRFPTSGMSLIHWCIRQALTKLFNPINKRGMVNAFDSLNTTKPHAVDVHFEAFLLDVIAVGFRGIIGINELTVTIGRYIPLLSASEYYTPHLSVSGYNYIEEWKDKTLQGK